MFFIVKDWAGKIGESEEMLPRWFDIDNIPFKKMWGDDSYWLLSVLSGKKIKKGKFVFTESNDVKDHDIEFC